MNKTRFISDSTGTGRSVDGTGSEWRYTPLPRISGFMGWSFFTVDRNSLCTLGGLIWNNGSVTSSVIWGEVMRRDRASEVW